MTDFHRELAQLLFPHVTTTPADLFRQYPPRDLPPGARVTRFAPSPTGFVHIGSLLTALVDSRVAQQSAASTSCASRTPTRSASRIAASSRSCRT